MVKIVLASSHRLNLYAALVEDKFIYSGATQEHENLITAIETSYEDCKQDPYGTHNSTEEYTQIWLTANLFLALMRASRRIMRDPRHRASLRAKLENMVEELRDQELAAFVESASTQV